MKTRKLFLLAFVIFILHSTLFQFLRIYGIMPNISLIFIVVFSAIFPEKEGLILAVMLGAFQDIFLSMTLGINLLIYVPIAFVIHALEDSLFKDNFLTPVAFLGVSTIFYYLAYFSFMYFLDGNVVFKPYLIVGFKEMVYNIAVGVFVYSKFLKREYGFSLR
ncbi:MAG: rod shape-determining protein MreD [Clostridia bacterium]|nr:rod shape-determining protein MreD [Clostridia bacterium]